MSEYTKIKTARTIICELCNELYPDDPCKPEGCDWLQMLEEDAVSVPQWISIKDRLPEVETEVLVACDRNGYRFACPAIYEDGTVLTQDSIWNWYDLENYGTYSEENDDYFVPQGWWENRQFTPDDIYNSPVDCAVTDWMPLPEPPKGENYG